MVEVTREWGRQSRRPSSSRFNRGVGGTAPMKVARGTGLPQKRLIFPASRQGVSARSACSAGDFILWWIRSAIHLMILPKVGDDFCCVTDA